VSDLSRSEPWDSTVLIKGSSFRPTGKGPAALNRRGALTKSQALAAAAAPPSSPAVPHVPSKYRAVAGAVATGVAGPGPGAALGCVEAGGGCQLQRMTTRDLQVSGISVSSYFVRFVRNHPQLIHVLGVQVKVSWC
jgi:hypothetical protein